MIKPAYSVSFLLSINIFVWQKVLYFPNDNRICENSDERDCGNNHSKSLLSAAYRILSNMLLTVLNYK